MAGASAVGVGCGMATGELPTEAEVDRQHAELPLLGTQHCAAG